MPFTVVGWPSTKIRMAADTITWIWKWSWFAVTFFGWLLLFGNSFWKPGGAARAARIMKMMSKTSNTSVNGVMLISAITSVSCLADVKPMLCRLLYFFVACIARSVQSGLPDWLTD